MCKWELLHFIHSFEYLMSCMHRDTYRGEALKAVGELALVIPDDAYSRLDVICSIIKESLNSYRYDSRGSTEI